MISNVIVCILTLQVHMSCIPDMTPTPTAALVPRTCKIIKNGIRVFERLRKFTTKWCTTLCYLC